MANDTCAQSGTLQGRVTGWGTGEVTGFPLYDLTYSEILAAPNCMLSAGNNQFGPNPFTSGSLGTRDQSSIYAQLIERLVCPSGSSSAMVDRVLQIALTRQQ